MSEIITLNSTQLSRDEEVQQSPTTTTSPNTGIREDSTQLVTQNSGNQQHFLLGVSLTGNRLLATSLILGLGIPKAIYANSQQSLISPTLDWVGGSIIAVILFWLGVIEFTNPKLYPLFFEVDLAPIILKFEHYDDLLLWIASVLPLILAVEGISFIVHIKRQIVKDVTSSDEAVRVLAQYSHGGPTHIQAVLGISIAVCLFGLIGLRVLWPGVLEGKGRYTFLILNMMIVAHALFLGVKTSRRQNDLMVARKTSSSCDSILLVKAPDYSQVMIAMTIRLYMWMMPLALPLLVSAVGSISSRSHLVWCMCVAILEVAFFIWERRNRETPTLLDYVFDIP